MEIYEIYKDEEIHQLMCFGHVDDVIFRQECVNAYNIQPIRIVKKWQRSKTILVNTFRGKKKRFISNEECQSITINSIPITIGYIN